MTLLWGGHRVGGLVAFMETAVVSLDSGPASG